MKTSLYETHLNLRAKMTEFAGWEMPLYYSGINDEVAAVRKTAGIFDLSHMGEFYAYGEQGLSLLQSVVTNDVSRIEVGQAQYNLLCNESGGVLDDLIIYRLDTGLYMPVVNASNTASDFEWMQAHNRSTTALENKSAETGLIAIQGPAAAAILHQLVDFELSDMKRFHIRQGSIRGKNTWVASTGYTGGPGYELYCDTADAAVLWDALIDAGQAFGAKPAGLGARDVLRVEAGYPLYGHELSTETTPLDAGLMWAVKLAKSSFVGKEAIEDAVKTGPSKKLVGLEAIDRCIPRHGYSVAVDGQSAGVITSGTFSPTLEKGIAMAYVPSEYGHVGDLVNIDIRGKSCAAKVVSTPFYQP